MDVIELVPGLHHLRFAVGHAYLWESDDGLTLIDAGVPGSGPEIAAAVRGLGRATTDVRRLFLTHFHEDHVGGAAAVAGWGDVTVYAHSADAPFIRREAPGPDPVLLDWERDLLAQVRSGMSGRQPQPVRIDKELTGGETLADGAQVLAVPGHTPGSVALYLPGPAVLFTGDTIARSPAGELMLGVFNVDRAAAIESFRLQAALEVRVACFGHGEPLLEDTTAALRGVARGLR